MEDLLQPFKVGEDIALFLVNFERTCEKAGFPLESWPQELLTLLPCEAADVIARLSRKDAVSYDKIKEALLRKCRLSAEAFRQRLSHTRKARTSDEGSHGGRGKMANRHAECLGRGKGSVLALVSDGLQEVTEVRDTLFSQCGNVGSAECKGQREGSLKGSDKARVREETLQSQLTSLESVAAVVQSQVIIDDAREDAQLKGKPEIPKRRARKSPKLRVPWGSILGAKRIARKRMSMRFRRRGFRLFSSFSLPSRGRSATRCRAHRYRDKGSKVCTKRRAKRRKRPQDRNAAKVATRLRKKSARNCDRGAIAIIDRFLQHAFEPPRKKEESSAWFAERVRGQRNSPLFFSRNVRAGQQHVPSSNHDAGTTSASFEPKKSTMANDI
ncbi:hypothetical protein HPB52_012524 [Rhipicephalus sanguineus]|uniref:Uncharacterized protein n=1 Tax=Rhipicephalus sanguineus TaxID=34632 RepID=A0A9D4PM23_RHISA|nr:hypothetical protein HPB52_012524 [Rhipicephalus sanguineus]